MKKQSEHYSDLAIRLFVLYSLFFISHFTLNAQQKILQHSGWEFRNISENTWHPAEVPGCIHSDLMRLKLIPDPYIGTNEQKVQWVDTCYWEYRKIVKLPEGYSSNDQFELVFEGLDTHADIFINNELKIRVDNMFRCWKLPLSGKDLQQKTEVKILFYAPTKTIHELAQKGIHRLPDDRGYLRKAPYHFGWDWGPTVPTSGIWKSVYLKKIEPIEIEDVYIRQIELTKTKARLQAEISIHTENSEIVSFKLNYASGKSVNQTFTLKQGTNNLQIPFTIENPILWWPNGHGKPNLYTIQISAFKDLSQLFTKKIKIGLRTIELVQKPDSIGESFYFKVNGKPIFAKGANYIPMDNFPSRVSKEKQSNLIIQAHEAGVNMLRIWGGGIYEDDNFYSLLDENGILCWQDFMFACNLYPADSAFLENVQTEATEQVIRLRQHPCIALWCGNNESNEGFKNWEWNKSLNWSSKDSVEIWQNYEKLFHGLLKDVVLRYNPERYYWPSSPSIGWGHKESLSRGDAHYWGVWWGMEPFSIYREKVGRFMSEYGFQGMPDLKTLEFAIPEKERWLFSPSLKQHQKHPTGFETINKYMEREFQLPHEYSKYQYYSQILQAEGMRTAIEAHRRAMPYCMGTLFWQWNDSWPVTSWSAIDWFGRKKALYYTATRSFKPTLPSYILTDSTITFYITSESEQKHEGKLNLTYWSGKQKKNLSLPFISHYGTQNILTLYKQDYPKFFQITKGVICAVWTLGKDTLQTEVIFPATIKDHQQAKANPKMQFVIKNKRHYLTLTSDVPVKYCRLRAKSEIDFSDNYFDLLPGIPKIIELRNIPLPFNAQKLNQEIIVEWLGK